MGTAPFDPSTFFVPGTDPDRLEYTADDLTSDGADITERAADIHTSWGGLASCYNAPEAEILFAAVDSVPSDAEEVDGALGTVAAALAVFAEKVRKLRKEAWELQGDAHRFNAKVADDEDWAKGTLLGGESEDYTEYTRINAEKIRIQNDFMAAEAECANDILALFSARRYTAVNPDGSTRLRGGEIAYGFTEITEELQNAWGEPAIGIDHYWFWDVQHAVWDFGAGIVENVGGMVGMHGAGGWDFEWDANTSDHWWGVVEGAGAMVGLYDAEIDHWGFQSWERTGEIILDTALETAHAFAPWTEWEERPAYMLTTLMLNAGTIAAGAALSSTGVGAVVGVPLLAYKGLKILDGVGGAPHGLTSALQDLVDHAAANHRGGASGSSGSTPTVSLTDHMLRALDIDPQRLHDLFTRVEGLRAPYPNPSPQEGGARAEQPVGPTAAELAAGQDFLDGVDPRSRAELEEGLRGTEDMWVVSQVPDDVSSVNDTPIRSYETAPSSIEVESGQRVGGDSAGNEIASHYNGTITNSVGGDNGSQNTLPGGTTTMAPEPGADFGSGSGHGGTAVSGADGNNGLGHGLSGGQGLTEDAQDRLNVNALDVKPVKRDDPTVAHLLPEEGERFGTGIVLEPNSRYVLYEADGKLTIEYLTDADGSIREIHADSKGWNAKNPEFMNPRPDMTYVVDGYTFKTDSHSRTISAEGTLQLGENVRNETQQDIVNSEARRYFQLLNEQYGHKYQDIQWDAGHLIGSQEFFGIGERLNLEGMRFDVNQNRTATALPDIPHELRKGIRGSYRNAERAWRGILSQGEKWHLFNDPRFNDGTWNAALALNPDNPRIDVKIEAVHDPDFPIITDPITGREIPPPPRTIFADWPLNGIEMDRLRYNNLPPKE